MQDAGEQAARQLLDRFGYGPPTDLDQILADLNLVVRPQNLEDAVSGMLLVEDDCGAIGVNRRHHPNRQRFTVAHEIGHFCLHRHESNLFIEAFYRNGASSQGTDTGEIQANAFAAELLMPEKIVRSALKDMPVSRFDERTTMRLAASFRVSVQAMTVRLSTLGLIAD